MKRTILCLIILFVPSNISAEIIKLNTGSTVVGELLEINEYDIRVDTTVGFPAYYYYDDIYSINGLFTVKFKEIYYQNKGQILDNEDIFLDDVNSAGRLKEETHKSDQIPNNKYSETADIDAFANNIDHKNSNNLLDRRNSRIEEIKTEEKSLDIVKDADIFINANIKLEKLQNLDEFIEKVKESNGVNRKKLFKSKNNNILSFNKNNENAVKVKLNIEKVQNIEGQKVDERMGVKLIAILINKVLKYESKFVVKKINFVVSKMPTLQNIIKFSLTDAFTFYKKFFGNRSVKFIIYFFWIILYVLYCYPLMILAKTFSIRKVWMAWIPIFQQILIIKMANKSLIFMGFYLIPFVRFINVFYLWGKIASYMGKSRIFGIYMLVPGLNIFILWHFSFFNRKLIFKNKK